MSGNSKSSCVSGVGCRGGAFSQWVCAGSVLTCHTRHPRFISIGFIEFGEFEPHLIESTVKWQFLGILGDVGPWWPSSGDSPL